MRNFVSLRSLLSRIPKALFEESTEAEFLDWFLDGLKLLPNTINYEPKIDLFEITDGKVQLPSYIKQINNVHWQCSDPSEECIADLQTTCGCVDEANDLNDQICRPAITYKQWLDSPYFRENYTILKYIGMDKSLISNNCNCLYSNCTETFTVNSSKTMYLSLDTGFICIDYDTPICDEGGNLLVPDYPLLHEFLIAYAIHKHWENRQFTKEEQAGNFYQAYLQKQTLLLRQARSDVFFRNFNVANILDITGGQYKKLIKIPELLIYAR